MGPGNRFQGPPSNGCCAGRRRRVHPHASIRRSPHTERVLTYGSTNTSKRIFIGVGQPITTQTKKPPLNGATLRTCIGALPMKRVVAASVPYSLAETNTREFALIEALFNRRLYTGERIFIRPLGGLAPLNKAPIARVD